jgi:hypothetical protein
MSDPDRGIQRSSRTGELMRIATVVVAALLVAG